MGVFARGGAQNPRIQHNYTFAVQMHFIPAAGALRYSASRFPGSCEAKTAIHTELCTAKNSGGQGHKIHFL